MKDEEEKEPDYNQPPWVAAVLAAENFSEAMKRISFGVKKVAKGGKFRGLVEGLKPGHHYTQPPWTAYVLSAANASSGNEADPNTLISGGKVYYSNDAKTSPLITADIPE